MTAYSYIDTSSVTPDYKGVHVVKSADVDPYSAKWEMLADMHAVTGSSEDHEEFQDMSVANMDQLRPTDFDLEARLEARMREDQAVLVAKIRKKAEYEALSALKKLHEESNKVPPRKKPLEVPVASLDAPKYITDVANCGPTVSNLLYESATLSYRAIAWAFVNKSVNKDTALHLYDMTRAGHMADVLTDLQTRLNSCATDIHVRPGGPLPAPVGGTVFCQGLWHESEDKTKKNEWLLAPLRKQVQEKVAAKVGSWINPREPVLALDPDGKVYALFNLINNMARLERMLNNGKGVSISVGGAILVEMTKDLKELVFAGDDRSQWCKLKILRASMMVANGYTLGGSIERVQSRVWQLDLLTKEDRTLETESELGKLLGDELAWGRSKTGPLYSRVITAFNRLFVNAYGPARLRLEAEIASTEEILRDLQEGLSNKGLGLLESVGDFFTVKSDEVLGRPLENVAKSTSTFIRKLSKSSSHNLAFKSIDFESLPDCYLAAMLTRLPSAREYVPAERIQAMAQKYYKSYDGTFSSLGATLEKDAYVKHFAYSRPKLPADLISSLGKVQRSAEVSATFFMVSLRVQVKSLPPEIKEWIGHGGMGLPKGIDATNFTYPTFRYSGKDWGDAAKLGDIATWLELRGYAKHSDMQYSLIVNFGKLPAEKWESAVNFLGDNSSALGNYLQVDPGLFEYRVRSHNELVLMPNKALRELDSKTFFRMYDISLSDAISTGNGLWWDSIQSVNVVYKLLCLVVESGVGDLGSYILPSTFLHRAGLRGKLFEEVRDGLARPASSGPKPGVLGDKLSDVMDLVFPTVSLRSN